VNQFKEIPVLESLLNFQKDACNIYHLQNVTTSACKGCIWSFANHGVEHGDEHMHRILNCIE